MLLLQLALGDGHIATETRLRSQKVVEAGVSPSFADIKSNCQQPPGIVVQEVILRVRKVATHSGQLVDHRQAVLSPLLSENDLFTKLGEPLDLGPGPGDICRVDLCQHKIQLLYRLPGSRHQRPQ